MDLILDIGTWISLLIGSFFLLITGLGLLRFPDLYTRIHAGGMADTLATAIICFGLALQSGFTLISVKLLFVFVFVSLTSPTATYALAQAAFVAGLKPRLDGFGGPSEKNTSIDTDD